MEVWMYIINASDSCAAYIFVETMIHFFTILLWIEGSKDQQSLLE